MRVSYLDWDFETEKLLDWFPLPPGEVKKIGDKYLWKEFTFESWQIWDHDQGLPKVALIQKAIKLYNLRRKNGHRSRRYEEKTVRRRQK